MKSLWVWLVMAGYEDCRSRGAGGLELELEVGIVPPPASPRPVPCVDDASVAWRSSTPRLIRVVFDMSVDTASNSVLAQAWASVRAEEAAERPGSLLTRRRHPGPVPLGEVVLDPEYEGEGVGRAVGVLTAILLFVTVTRSAASC